MLLVLGRDDIANAFDDDNQAMPNYSKLPTLSPSENRHWVAHRDQGAHNQNNLWKSIAKGIFLKRHCGLMKYLWVRGLVEYCDNPSNIIFLHKYVELEMLYEISEKKRFKMCALAFNIRNMF